MNASAPSIRTTVRRLPECGVYDRATIDAILDEGLLCHVGFRVEAQPYVIPFIYARIGERLYLHGSSASRMLRAISAGAPVCVTVTLLDGLVLARSAFHHSMNYRSVVVLGTASRVDDAEEHALDVWAGVVPLALAAGAPIADSELREGIPVPAHACHYQRPQRGES